MWTFVWLTFHLTKSGHIDLLTFSWVYSSVTYDPSHFISFSLSLSLTHRTSKLIWWSMAMWTKSWPLWWRNSNSPYPNMCPVTVRDITAACFSYTFRCTMHRLPEQWEMFGGQNPGGKGRSQIAARVLQHIPQTLSRYVVYIHIITWSLCILFKYILHNHLIPLHILE